MRRTGALAGFVSNGPASARKFTCSARWHQQFATDAALRHDLLEALATDDRPSRVWAYYRSLMNILDVGQLPFELHQQVLRKCAPPPGAVRATNIRRIPGKDTWFSHPHIYESRLQAVIRNMRLMEKNPELEDYHFILKHFASVGHHAGAMQVYKEIIRVGHKPNQKTFGYCLQALAYRLTLPIVRRAALIRTNECRAMLDELLTEMRNHGVPFSAINLEMVIRVLKDTVDAEGFETLMRTCYGIDLSNPDCIPLEFAQPGPDGLPPTALPFNTAALNTTIDVLGRLGNVSKMVQAFEVLTSPLPDAQNHINTSFDDDGEDDFGAVAGPLEKAIFTAPHASPNTTTYNILVRHLCRANHTVLARHYLLMAFSLDRITSRETIQNVLGIQQAQVQAPHFAINRTTLVPVLGTANRNKDMGLMRWLFSKLPKHIKSTKNDLQYFVKFRQGLSAFRLWPYGSAPSLSIPTSQHKVDRAETPSTDFKKSASLPRLGGLSQRVPILMPKSTDVLDLDIEQQDAIPWQQPVKFFDINLHIGILERNVDEISSLREHMEHTLSRTTQRVKEKLGRRIWAGKDVYLQTDRRRTQVSPRKWIEIVNFKPRAGYTPSSLSSQREREQAPRKSQFRELS